MVEDKGFAPAKVNLSLHVTGQRPDGYHLLDSLVVFAGMGDQITAKPARTFSLSVTGPFAEGVPVDDSNLVLRAARALQQARGVRIGATLTLTKRLPHAAGLGSGSADAAATLQLLSALWDVPAPGPGDHFVLALGADVPVCLAGPGPLRMQGVGEVLSPLPQVPGCALVLVNPRVSVPTRDVFAALAHKDNPPMSLPAAWPGPDDFLLWLGAQRNDLQPAAQAIAPAVTQALDLLRRTPGIEIAAMSGSGATCFGVTRDMGVAQRAARAIQITQMGWWVAPAPIMGIN